MKPLCVNRLLACIALALAASAATASQANAPRATDGPAEVGSMVDTQYKDRPDLALNKSVVGSAACKSGEEASKAVDGKLASQTQDKFCSLQQPAWFRVDLGSAMPIEGFTVKHAGAGGEPESMNTRAFKIRVSPDGKDWRTVVTEFSNTASITHHRIATIQARYVELQVTRPTQTDDPATRIYELEVW